MQRAEELVARSINALTERHGFGTMARLRPPDFQLLSLRDDPDGLWIAEADGEIVGFAFSWVCGDLWFLAELFVAPDHQGAGLGNQLLMRTLEHARKTGATNKALITFAFNSVSQGLYIRQGFFPRLPLYFLNVTHDTLMSRFRGETLQHAQIADTPSHLGSLRQIDASVLGISRDKHHRYLLNEKAMKGVFFYEGGDRVGYAYVSADGHIGPLAVVQRNAMGAAFETALRLSAQRGTPQVSAFVPGASEALGIAIERGMRITFPMVLASARDFGDWTRYLPRNPGYM